MDATTKFQRENDLLKSQLADRDETISQYDCLIANYDAQLEVLREQLKQALMRRYSSSSEKLPSPQLELFNEAETDIEQSADEKTDEPSVTVVPHQRRRRPRVSIPDDYPREDIIHDLPEVDKVCPHDGTELRVIGSEDHEQLDIIPAQIKVLRHKRLKYACPCCDKHIVTASKPAQPIEKSIASAGLLAFIAVQKYADALPLYRQSEMFKRIGIELKRHNLANWMVKCGVLIQPLINLLIDHILQHTVLHMDETPVQVLDEPGKPAQSKSYMWLMMSSGEQPACVFHYSETRSQRVPLALLSSDTHAMMVDGYEGYGKACDTYDITRIGCWAHARRKFVEAKSHQPKGKTGRADQALSYIQKLYALEKVIKDDPPDKRYRARQEKAKPILKKLKAWMDNSLMTVPPKVALGKALHYLNNQWSRLIRYLDDGHYPIDNNAAERAIRPFTIGRKNWLFSKSQAGAKSSANLYSLIQTAKANGLNEYDYLRHVFKELPNAQSLEHIEALLPWNVQIT